MPRNGINSIIVAPYLVLSAAGRRGARSFLLSCEFFTAEAGESTRDTVGASEIYIATRREARCKLEVYARRTRISEPRSLWLPMGLGRTRGKKKRINITWK